MDEGKESAMRLRDKVAVVVGAGQSTGDTIGNGRATALLFAREGAQVLAVDRDDASVRETVEMIEAEGGRAIPFAADITDEDATERIAPAALGEFGKIDILHNNVGIGTGDGGVTKLAREVWDRIFEVNVTGMFLTCKHVIPHMRESGGGAIVNVSSTAAVGSASTVRSLFECSQHGRRFFPNG